MTRRHRSTRSAALLIALMTLVGAGGLRVTAQDASATPDASAIPGASSAPGHVASAPPSLDIETIDRASPEPDLVVSNVDLDALVQGNTDFAFDLLRQTHGANVALGPLSISIALAMQLAGADGATARQMARVLHLDLPRERRDAAFDRLRRELGDLARPGLESSIVSQLFGQSGYEFGDDFLDTISSHYAAPLAVLDFARDADAARQVINGFVAAHTAGRIADLIPPGAVTGLTRLVLVNATYLKADWERPFNAAFTEARPFLLASGKRVRVPTMAMSAGEATARGPGYQAIELPYVGGRLAMLIVVPDDLGRFERTLTAARLATLVSRLREDGVDLTLPIFSSRTQVDLIPSLTALGMRDAFDPQRADLSGVSDEPGLHVSAAIHQAYISVAEQGTEAAAATAIGDTGTSGPPPKLNVDRPFLWIIRDRVTGTILYLGHVTDPRITAH